MHNLFFSHFMPLLSPDTGAGGAGGAATAAEPEGKPEEKPAGEPKEKSASKPEKAPEKKPEELDLEKLKSLIDGKLQVTEETVMKSYFRQQGLSGDEVTQAITAFKSEKAKNQPDVAALQAEAKAAKEAAAQAALEKEAAIAAMELGVDAKALPYVLKLADCEAAVKTDGSIDPAAVKKAIEAVLTVVPAFKTQGAAGTDYKPKGGSTSKISRAAEIAKSKAEANKKNPYASAWGQF